MPSDNDANIKLLSAVDLNKTFTIDDVANKATFDVLADVEIGEDLNQVVDSFELHVAIRNLSKSETVATATKTGNLTPVSPPVPFLNQERVNIPANWAPADPGDVLQAVASYIVTAGANKDFSSAQSQTFIVS